MKQWRDLIYNPATGAFGLKKDYVGTIIVTQFNRAGDIFRTITLEDAFISSGLPFLTDGDYESADPQELAVTWRVDSWKEDII
jgi:hypothetical protein